MKKLVYVVIVVLISCCTITQLHAQDSSHAVLTPNGLLDSVFDQDGNGYRLQDLAISDNIRNNGKTGSKLIKITCLSTSYFQVWMDSTCGMAGSSAPEVARRDVLCQVLHDLSAFIQSPLTGGPQKVNIWVRNIDSMSAPAGALGGATSFYTIPHVGSGIADNTAWLTIVSGKDAYTNVAPPVYSTDPYSAYESFFHMTLAFRFNGTYASAWHTTLTDTTAVGKYDLYTVLLHEISHALGFHSLQWYNGNSILDGTGTGSFNYFSRYDSHLKTVLTNDSLITKYGTGCSLYNYHFNPGLNALKTLSPNYPGCTLPSPIHTDLSACDSAIKYVFGSGSFTSQKVYTPRCYERGSSLSHFEDQCQVPAGSGFTIPSSNNLYFVMSDASPTGPPGMKRFLKPEERQVLCDIGYKVDTTYGILANKTYCSYSGGICPGVQVAGINDGLDSFVYTYAGGVGDPISLPGILSNDYGTYRKFSCLEPLIGSGTLSVTSGGSTVIPIYTPDTGDMVHLLRYIPIDSVTGKVGNITYIYVYVYDDSACVANACNFIRNSDFESGSFCGNMLDYVHCWRPICYTPDYYSTSCSNNSSVGFSAHIPTNMTAPAGDVYNPSDTLNDHFMGLMCDLVESDDTLGFRFEAMGAKMVPNLIIGVPYIVSFYARTINNFKGNPTVPYVDGHLQLRANNSPLATDEASIYPLIYSGTTGIFNVTKPLIPGSITVPADSQWHHFFISFTADSSYNYFYLLNNPYPTALANFAAGYYTTDPSAHAGPYIFVDDVSIIQDVAHFHLPTDTQCLSYITTDLSPLVDYPGGVFSGPGVYLHLPDSSYQFIADSAGTGWHVVSYTYHDGVGCTQTVSDSIYITNTFITVTASALSPSVCYGSLDTLTASGATTYSWFPTVTCIGAGCSSGSATITTSPTTFTVTGTDASGNCSDDATVSVTLLTPPAAPTTSTTTYCQSAITSPLTATGAAGATFHWYTAASGGIGTTTAPTPSSATIGTYVWWVSQSVGAGCESARTPDTVRIVTCCSTCTPLGASGTLSSSPAAGFYCLLNDVTIAGSVSLNAVEIKIMSGKKIIIPSGASLRIVGSHLYACDSMWRGIEVQSGGRLSLYSISPGTGKETLIEDAITAIRVQASSLTTGMILTADSVTFNRNLEAIRIESYSPSLASYPFRIENCVFTCRALPGTPGTYSWPGTRDIRKNNNTPGLTNPLISPYIKDSLYAPIGTNAFLRVPYAGIKSQRGIVLSRVGPSPSGSAPTTGYYGITIGELGLSGTALHYNVFDNLDTGIHATMSNVKVVNCIFQNPYTNNIIKKVGIGIYDNAQIEWHKLEVNSSVPYINRFWNCTQGIHTENVFKHNIYACDFRSNQSTADTTGAWKPGKYGILMNTNRYDTCSITYNAFYNTNIGVMLNSVYGNLLGSSVPAIQYNGDIEINNNLVQPQYSGSLSTQYVRQGIVVKNIIPGGVWAYLGKRISTKNNTLRSVGAGILVDSWPYKDVLINSNIVSMKVNSTVPVDSMRYGIRLQGGYGATSFGDEIYDNSVRGSFYPTISTTTNQTGIDVRSNKNSYVHCNNVDSSQNGLRFFGGCTPAKFYTNDIYNKCRIGMMMEANAVIGTQGSPTVPANNRWFDTWAAGTYKTGVSATVISPSMPMWVRNSTFSTPSPGGTYNPNGSATIIGFGTPYQNISGNLLYGSGTGGCSTGAPPGGGSSGMIIDLETLVLGIKYEPDSVNSEYVGLCDAYFLIRSDSTLTDSSGTLASFIAGYAGSSYDFMWQIDSCLYMEDTSAARSIMTGWAPSNGVDENYLTYYDLLMKAMGQTFDRTDSISLYDLAQGCPVSEGTILYSARNLFTFLYGDDFDFPNDCFGLMSKSGPGEVEENDGNGIKVYPNPTDGLLNIDLPLSEQSTYTVTVSDVTGKKIVEQTCSGTLGTVKINLHGANGLYLVSVTDTQTGIVISKKINLQR